MNYARISILPAVLFSFALNADQDTGPATSQKEAIHHMHEVLHDAQAPFKEKEALALKALNELTINESVRIEDVNGKIDELMAAKTQIMRLRYAHLIEMRTVLSDEQKVGYDEGVLNRSAVE
jgi:hypothetical protein